MSKHAGRSRKPEAPHPGDERLDEARTGRPIQADVAARAYELYLTRGEDGHDLDDWLQAERELAIRRKDSTRGHGR